MKIKKNSEWEVADRSATWYISGVYADKER